MITTAFYDPAAREGKKHDYKAIVVGSLANAIYYVRYAFIRKCTVQDVLEELYVVDRKFPNVFQGFEQVGFQALYKELLKYKAHEKGYPITVYGQDAVGNKQVRIESLSGFVENGSIVFQKDAHGYTSDIGLLVEQLLDFPNGAHDDGPDALKYAFDMARNKAMKAAYGSVKKNQQAEPDLTDGQPRKLRTTRQRKTPGRMRLAPRPHSLRIRT